MKLGILQCDDVCTSLKDSHGNYSDMFEDAFLKLDDTFEIVVYRAHNNELPKDINECDAYVITGSRAAVFDDLPWINKLSQFVILLDKAKVKTIGICFGHQLIADSLGGLVERSELGWCVGYHTFKLLNDSEYINPKLDNFVIPMMCEDNIQTPPKNTQIIASTPQCKYAMLQYDNHFLTLQGHPEFSNSFAKSLLTYSKDIIPLKRYEKGIESLADDNNNDTIFKWLDNFIRNKPLKQEQDKQTT